MMYLAVLTGRISGVWTLKAQGKKPTMKVALTAATPTYTHMALAALYEAELLRYVVSTNCDGLHRRYARQPILFPTNYNTPH
jgi:NAD-dependent SIR2 family protein deacetylase